MRQKFQEACQLVAEDEIVTQGLQFSLFLDFFLCLWEKYFNLPIKIKTGSVGESLTAELQCYCCRPGVEKNQGIGLLRVFIFTFIMGRNYYSRYVLVFNRILCCPSVERPSKLNL